MGRSHPARRKGGFVHTPYFVKRRSGGCRELVRLHCFLPPSADTTDKPGTYMIRRPLAPLSKPSLANLPSFRAAYICVNEDTLCLSFIAVPNAAALPVTFRRDDKSSMTRQRPGVWTHSFRSLVVVERFF